MREFSKLGLITCLATCLLACGSGGETGPGSVAVTFSFLRNGERLGCESVPEVERVEWVVFTAEGTTVRGGYPKTQPCTLDSLLLNDLPSGTHVIEVRGRGPLGDDDDAILFKARQSFETPLEAGFALALRPEVAFLDVAWNFGEHGLLPCDVEVPEIEVTLNAGANATFRERFDCSATPARIPVPLAAINYLIKIDAYSLEDFILFSSSEMRTLERGDNTYVTTLLPLGNRLLLDFEFKIGAQEIRACDDPRVAVTQINARVRNILGGPPAMETFLCAEARPRAFRAQRYGVGQMLELELVGEGAARFRAVDQFTMGTSDRVYEPPLLLEAIGTATVAMQVDTATCAVQALDVFSIEILTREGSNLVSVASLQLFPEAAATRFEAIADELPYGDYEVQVAQQRGANTICSASGSRVISARFNTWAPFIF